MSGKYRTQFDEVYHSMKVMEKGNIAQKELNCGSCKTVECCMMTSSMIVGGIAGFLVGGPVGILIGVSIGCVWGLFLNVIKKQFC